MKFKNFSRKEWLYIWIAFILVFSIITAQMQQQEDLNNQVDYNSLTLEEKVKLVNIESQLFIKCRESIRKTAISDKTVDFSNESIQLTHQKWKEVLVTWTAEATNAFNVRVKNSYACYFSYTQWAETEFNWVEFKIL